MSKWEHDDGCAQDEECADKKEPFSSLCECF